MVTICGVCDGGGVSTRGFVLAAPLRLSARRYRPYYADEGILGFTPMGIR